TNEEQKLLEENENLVKELEKLKAALELKSPEEKQNKKQKVIKVKNIDEKTTRENLIDLELFEAGYDVKNFKNGKDTEYKLVLEDGSFGYADYVIWNDDIPIAVIEAKRTSADVNKGKHQAQVYANALKKKFGNEVLIFVTNGRVIEYKNELYPFREIHSFFPKDELLRALNKLESIKKNIPSKFEINNDITNRGYQKRAIKNVLKNYESKKSRALLVMATGSGKTRVAASITDVLLKASWIRKVLFLADRKELVKQARKNFDEYLSETSVNLVLEKDLQNRMHFGTYETVHNLIKKDKYNSAFFDLIIVDEAHRSIYKKYKAIFEYFDSLVLGLTATPTGEIHRNTYEFFQTDFEEPTDSYTLDQAIEDEYLVNFNAFEIDLGIVSRGINYADLSNDEKEEFEEKFENEFDEELEDDKKNIDAKEINKRILNKETNEKVLDYLFNHGLKIEDGNKIGKTIIFAKNQKHAEFIKQVFDLKYPSISEIAQIIHSEIAHVDSLLDDFKNPSKNPQIAISVDMLDTGIDVPEILNLVFFKPIKSKTKFWQMIGRGTRLCPDIFDVGVDKDSFKIFDFCQNFTYFGVNSEGLKPSNTKSLKERLFLKRVKLLMNLEEDSLKENIQSIVKQQISNINAKAYNVKKHKHLIQDLQKNSLDFISDDMFSDINTICEYIEDSSDYEVQRFEILILNTQENILNEKNNDKNIKELKQKAQILRTRDIK
ncbi:MAG: DEAD/DEAH box helicase family protein, partial [Poseidonibacter sp.]|uniref:type I restriction endonuclease subunit R n=1 Tax=Poseidonibacter sp. TaxID=2321188 RepID=UPI00359E2C01